MPEPCSAPSKKAVTFAVARRLALSLPGVEEGTCYGTPGFRVKGKFMARVWEDGETLVVKCGDDERDIWMQIDPDTFFVTDHYRGYPAVLVRLPLVDPAALREVLEQAWRLNAPKKLVAERDGGKMKPAVRANVKSTARGKKKK